MHTQFANHVTSTAFSLTLNRTAIEELVTMYHIEDQSILNLCPPWIWGYRISNKATLSYLLRRGLIVNISNDPRDRDDYCLTRPGVLAAQLSIEAGFDLDERYRAAVRKMAVLGPPDSYRSAFWSEEENIRERWGRNYHLDPHEDHRPEQSSTR